MQHVSSIIMQWFNIDKSILSSFTWRGKKTHLFLATVGAQKLKILEKIFPRLYTDWASVTYSLLCWNLNGDSLVCTCQATAPAPEQTPRWESTACAQGLNMSQPTSGSVFGGAASAGEGGGRSRRGGGRGAARVVPGTDPALPAPARQERRGSAPSQQAANGEPARHCRHVAAGSGGCGCCLHIPSPPPPPATKPLNALFQRPHSLTARCDNCREGFSPLVRTPGSETAAAGWGPAPWAGVGAAARTRTRASPPPLKRGFRLRPSRGVSLCASGCWKW